MKKSQVDYQLRQIPLNMWKLITYSVFNKKNSIATREREREREREKEKKKKGKKILIFSPSILFCFPGNQTEETNETTTKKRKPEILLLK